LSLAFALLIFFYVLAAISIYLGVVSLRNGVRFIRYLQAELAKEYPEYEPFVTVFLPLRGADHDLEENVTALFAQTFANYEVVFVGDDANDPAWGTVESARQSFAGESGPTMQIVVAGRANSRGQKVHNLSVAIEHADPESEIFAFVDSDARVAPYWLAALVAPLQDETIGATTGYRWFVPARNNFAAHLRSVWNASIASALRDTEKSNFCWGGSTAISRRTFEQSKVLEHWRGALSDDFAMTRALRAAGLPIKFVPLCLTPSYESCSFSELLEFTTRQLKITRVYAPHLWQAVFFGAVIFALTFFGGIALVVTRAALGVSFMTPLILILIMFAMGAAKSHLRVRVIAAVIGNQRANSTVSTVAHVVLWPLASALYLYNAIAAVTSRKIKWRGIDYELKSPNETVIIRDELQNRER
jgi:ceramide glucosyltransferase